MHRVLILVFLAIASLAFAVDSSDTILQAKTIADTSVTLTWSPVDGATTYKVSYDESALLAADGAKPLFDSEVVKQAQVTIPELTPATDYTFFVHAFAGDKDIKTSLPVHVTTFHTSPFTLSGDPIVIDASTIQISFTRGIDTKKTQISILNPTTKKEIAVDHLESSTEDLRIVLIKTKQKLETGVLYNLVLKKVFTLAGTELSSENKTTLTISSTGINVSAPAVLAPETITTPAQSIPEEKAFDEPVPIDTLPQTGSETIFLLFLLAGGITFMLQKKLHKGA